MNRQFLFVYGTLRKDFGLRWLDALSTDLAFVGKGRVQAALYDLGSYPGAVAEGPGSPIVAGDVYTVMDEARVFSALDEYEGEEYRRERTTVELDSGKWIIAWIYWYAGDVQGKERIPGGDYLLYLKNKKDRFV